MRCSEKGMHMDVCRTELKKLGPVLMWGSSLVPPQGDHEICFIIQITRKPVAASIKLIPETNMIVFIYFQIYTFGSSTYWTIYKWTLFSFWRNGRKYTHCLAVTLQTSHTVRIICTMWKLISGVAAYKMWEWSLRRQFYSLLLCWSFRQRFITNLWVWVSCFYLFWIKCSSMLFSFSFSLYHHCYTNTLSLLEMDTHHYFGNQKPF